MSSSSLSRWLLVLMALLALVPAYAAWAQEPFVITFVTRVLVFALAALVFGTINGLIAAKLLATESNCEEHEHAN